MSTLTDSTGLTEAPLTFEERAVLGQGDPQVVAGKLRELDSGKYLTIARIGKSSDPERYVYRIRRVGLGIGPRGNDDYGFVAVPIIEEDVFEDFQIREVRVFRR